MKKRILFVCLGNICRSPAAEAVFSHLVKSKGLEEDFEIDSAGTGGWHVGQPADKRMRNSAMKRGIPITSLARKISSYDLDSFDLILTMDDDNLAAVSNLAKQTGTNLDGKIKPLLRYATQTNLKEVPDPYYGGEGGFEMVLDLLNDACTGLLEELLN